MGIMNAPGYAIIEERSTWLRAYLFCQRLKALKPITCDEHLDVGRESHSALQLK